MRAADVLKPSVPVAYGLLTIQLATKRGVDRAALLRGLGIGEALLETPDGRLSMDQYSRLIDRSIRLTRDAGLGYEFGLRTNLTAHGFIGLGLISQSTVRDAIEFGIRFVRLRTPIYELRSFVEEETGVIDVREAIPFGRLRRYAFDMLLVTWARMAQVLAGERKIDLEIWFDYPEPDYYTRYRDRLPPARFARGSNQLRFPAAYLDLPLETANPVTARLVTDSCNRELEVLGEADDFLARVRAVLVAKGGGYPSLDAVAARLFVSERTLKRRLLASGFTFRQLLDEARRRDSIRLLRDTTFSVQTVSRMVGYADPANFTRAFRKWTGTSPGDFRERGEGGSPVAPSSSRAVRRARRVKVVTREPPGNLVPRPGRRSRIPR
ncbi:MAG: AraC family transcriptional regulator [Candidatus Binatia bacterium]